MVHPMSDAPKVRAKLRQALLWVQAKWAGFRAESTYTQARVGLVAAWIAVSILTVLIAPPAVQPWRVTQVRLSFGLAFKTALEIENANAGDQHDVTVEVTGRAIEFDGKETPGVWHTDKLDIPQARGAKVRILPEQLKGRKGAPSSYSLIIENVRILDDDGDPLYATRPQTSGHASQA